MFKVDHFICPVSLRSFSLEEEMYNPSLQPQKKGWERIFVLIAIIPYRIPELNQ